MAQQERIAIENARIGFRNFAGEATPFSPAGKRTFHIFLDPELATQMEDAGYNVKWLEPRDPDEAPQAHVKVNVKFGKYPPNIVLITGRGQTTLDEKTVNLLDYAQIANVDVIISPYDWEVGDKSGRTAYLKSMYVTIVEDEFASKYRDVPEVGGPEEDEDF